MRGGDTMDMRQGGLLVLIWMTRGSTSYGIENKDALMPDRGVHCLNVGLLLLIVASLCLLFACSFVITFLRETYFAHVLPNPRPKYLNTCLHTHTICVQGTHPF